MAPPRKFPRRRANRCKGYRTLQCECCRGRFPSSRALENHRTISRTCYDNYNLIQNDLSRMPTHSTSSSISGIRRVKTSNASRGISFRSNYESNRPQPVYCVFVSLAEETEDRLTVATPQHLWHTRFV